MKITNFALVLILGTSSAFAQMGEPGRDTKGFNALKNVYFGEQHLHTTNSPDAFSFGTRNTPDDAYNFCKGKPIWYTPDRSLVKKRDFYPGLQARLQ